MLYFRTAHRSTFAPALLTLLLPPANPAEPEKLLEVLLLKLPPKLLPRLPKALPAAGLPKPPPEAATGLPNPALPPPLPKPPVLPKLAPGVVLPRAPLPKLALPKASLEPKVVDGLPKPEVPLACDASPAKDEIPVVDLEVAPNKPLPELRVDGDAFGAPNKPPEDGPVEPKEAFVFPRGLAEPKDTPEPRVLVAPKVILGFCKNAFGFADADVVGEVKTAFPGVNADVGVAEGGFEEFANKSNFPLGVDASAPLKPDEDGLAAEDPNNADEGEVDD